MTDFKSLLAGAKMPERIVQLCLRGDLTAEVEKLFYELQKAKAQKTDSLAGNGTGELIERIEALQAEMREHTAPVRLRALPRARWRELKEKHPPRRDDDGDALPEDLRSGVNRATFFEPLVRASVVDPDLTDSEWSQLLDAITDMQFEELAGVAWELNQERVDVPFSPAALQKIRDSFSE